MIDPDKLTGSILGELISPWLKDGQVAPMVGVDFVEPWVITP